MLWQVKTECEIKNKMVNDNERLDQIIQELEHRNRELSAMLLQNMADHAKNYKDQALKKLKQRPNSECVRNYLEPDENPNTTLNNTLIDDE